MRSWVGDRAFDSSAGPVGVDGSWDDQDRVQQVQIGQTASFAMGQASRYFLGPPPETRRADERHIVLI